MILTSYPCSLPDGSNAAEYAFGFDRNGSQRLLIVPALFDEGHRMRRLCVDVMRRLDGSGIASFLPDLPGTNESMADLSRLSLDDWAVAVSSAANHLRASHVLAIRGGGLLAPPGLPGWIYGPVKGESLLRTMVRARVLASQEAGREERGESLLVQAREQGVELAGHLLSAAMAQQLQAAQPAALAEIAQDLIEGSPLWLRAEPETDADQADALAAYITMAMRA